MQGLDLTRLAGRPKDDALVTPDLETLTYGQLSRQVDELKAALNWPAKALVLVASPRSTAGFVAYLAALSIGHAVLLVEEEGDDSWAELIDAYEPDLLV